MDAYHIDAQYHKAKLKHPQLLFLLLSSANNKELDDNEFFLKKPVYKTILDESLKQICHFLSAGISTVSNDVGSLTATKEVTKKININILNNLINIEHVNLTQTADSAKIHSLPTQETISMKHVKHNFHTKK